MNQDQSTATTSAHGIKAGTTHRHRLLVGVFLVAMVIAVAGYLTEFRSISMTGCRVAVKSDEASDKLNQQRLQEHDMMNESNASDYTTRPIVSSQGVSTKLLPTPTSMTPIVDPARGIILCLHDDIMPLGLSLVRELRCLGNQEVVEIYHCDELSQDSLDMLHAVDGNIRVVDVCSNLVRSGVMTAQLARTFRSYWIKPLAVHQTQLREVIMLDADVILMKDPAQLRETPGYRENGTLFFYDRVVNLSQFFNRNVTTSKKIKKKEQYLRWWTKHFDYKRFGSKYGPSTHLLESFAYRGETCHEQDSSMILIDKRRAGRAMDILWFLITEERFKFAFSWGDKEAFWLSYEFSQTPYFFSPWGASVVSSTSNHDLEIHPDTLCGSLAHYVPVEDGEPELMYVNGKALVDPVPFNVTGVKHVRPNHVFNMLPTHVAPRGQRSAVPVPEQGKDFMECLTGLGAVPAPPQLRASLWRRRMHFTAISMNLAEPLATC